MPGSMNKKLPTFQKGKVRFICLYVLQSQASWKSTSNLNFLVDSIHGEDTASVGLPTVAFSMGFVKTVELLSDS